MTSSAPLPVPPVAGRASATGPATGSELALVELFRDVSVEAVWSRLRALPVLELGRGDVLLAPGDEGQDVFVVLAGRMAVHLGALDDEPIQFIEQGETVGELALLDDQPRSAWVTATCRSRVLPIPADMFWSLLTSSHEIALNLLTTLALRVRKSNGVLTRARDLALLYRRHASVDALTGLHNRRWLAEVLPRLVLRSRMQGDALSVLLIDVDHFKRVNDTWGHAAGDFVLFAVSQVLKDRLRPTDLVARYGGEELLAVLPRTPIAGARAAAERVRRAIAELPLCLPDGRTLPSVTVSVGVAEMASDQDAGKLVAAADARLYDAKRGGRNRIEG